MKRRSESAQIAVNTGARSGGEIRARSRWFMNSPG